MKLQDPYTGVVIEAAESAVERLMAHGFKKPETKPEKAETKRKKA